MEDNKKNLEKKLIEVSNFRPIIFSKFTYSVEYKITLTGIIRDVDSEGVIVYQLIIGGNEEIQTSTVLLDHDILPEFIKFYNNKNYRKNKMSSSILTKHTTLG